MFCINEINVFIQQLGLNTLLHVGSLFRYRSDPTWSKVFDPKRLTQCKHWFRKHRTTILCENCCSVYVINAFNENSCSVYAKSLFLVKTLRVKHFASRGVSVQISQWFYVKQSDWPKALDLLQTLISYIQNSYFLWT